MSFIGVVANRKCFEHIKRKIIEQVKDETINFIQINLRSIENVKNIKFETIIIEDNLDKFKKNKETLEKIWENTEYILINTDKNPKQQKIEESIKKITYGLNQKAVVTISSVSDTDILIYWQKDLFNKEGKKIEIEERRIKKRENNMLKLYEIIIIYTFFKIYNYNIIEEIQAKSDFFE